MPDITVEIRRSVAGLETAWNDLLARAAPNVFLDPAALNAIVATGFSRLHVVLAWQGGGVAKRLAGVWALGERMITPVGPACLTAPVHDYAFVGSPVIDTTLVDAVLPAMLAALAEEPSLPRLLQLKYLDGAAATWPALRRALDARGYRYRLLTERDRPFATREAGPKRNGSTRKKLRQDWNRLTRLGTLDILNDRSSGAVAGAFETFLALEAAGWKGASGTALLSRPADATLTRRMINDLAAAGRASVALLRLDGNAIAAQVLLYCRDTAYTWKTAFDADYGKYSPGTVLVGRLSEDLLAGDSTAIELCSPEGGFMAHIWDGRRPTVGLLVNLSAGKTLGFAVAAAHDRAYAGLKDLRDRYRASQRGENRAA